MDAKETTALSLYSDRDLPSPAVFEKMRRLCASLYKHLDLHNEAKRKDFLTLYRNPKMCAEDIMMRRPRISELELRLLDETIGPMNKFFAHEVRNFLSGNFVPTVFL